MSNIEECIEKAANEAKVKALMNLYSQYNSKLRERERLFEQTIRYYALTKDKRTIESATELLYGILNPKYTKLASKLLITINSITEDSEKNHKEFLNKRKGLPELTLDLILNRQESYIQLILPLKEEDTKDDLKIFGAIYKVFRDSIATQDKGVKEEYFNNYLSFKTSKTINHKEVSKLVNKDTLLDTAKIKFSIEPYNLPKIIPHTYINYIEVTLPESITKKKPAWQRFGILPVDTRRCLKTSDTNLRLKDFFPKHGHKFIISDGKGYEFETWQDTQGRINKGMTEFYRRNKVRGGSVLRLEETEPHKKYALSIVSK